MKFIEEIPLSRFGFWSGAKKTADLLTEDELDRIEEYLESIAYDREPYTETEINDMFWFDFDELFSELLGFTEDELFKTRSRNEYGQLIIKEEKEKED